MVENERKDDNTGDSGGKSPKKLRVLLRTFGCQMNTRDSEIISGILLNAGYKLCDNAQSADIVIINTCSVRQHAEDRVWSQIGAYKNKKAIGLVGCMAQNYKDYAFTRCPDISFVAGPQDIHKIPEIINKCLDNNFFERKIWETDTLKRPEEIYHAGFYNDKKHAYVVISEGCSNFCSYCVVPYVRGKLRHRQSKDIINEIKAAIKKGNNSITLLGQNVNAYKDGNTDFLSLLEEINALEGLKEFNFMTSHPKDTTEELFLLIRDLDKLKKHLHLPVQSGSDRILKLMNRGYKREFYLKLAKGFRSIVKNGALTTDLIVGFPTEDKTDFRQTYDLVKTAGFDMAYIFKYSPRPHTESAKMADTVSAPEKESRHKKILELQRKISKAKKSERKLW